MIVTTERKDPRLGLGGLFYLVNGQNCDGMNSLIDRVCHMVCKLQKKYNKKAGKKENTDPHMDRLHEITGKSFILLEK